MSEWPTIRFPLELSADCVHVIRVSLDLPSVEWEKLRALLSDDERERASRFRLIDPRRRFVICRATLRQILADCCGRSPGSILFQYGVHGKPELALTEISASTPPIEFNVSHSGDLALIAVGLDSPIGIDLEEQDSRVQTLKLAERFFSEFESKELAGLPTEKQFEGFYRGWTCKEAYLKATGRGLSLSLKSFGVTIDPDQKASLRFVEGQPNESAQWFTATLNVGTGFSAALMLRKTNCHIECWDWPK